MIRTKIKHLYFIPLVLILATLVIPLFPPQKAEAAEVTIEDNVKISLDLKWINRSEINLSNLQFSYRDDQRTISEETFDTIETFGLQPLIDNLRQNNEGNYKDGDLLDNDSITWMTYGGTSWNYRGGKYAKDKCGNAMETVLVPNLMHNTGNNEALIRLGELIITTVGDCDALLDESQHQTEFKVNIGDEANRDIWFKMNNDQELERVDNGEKYIRRTPDNPNRYTGPKDGDKFKFVELNEESLQKGELLVLADFETQDVDRGKFSVRVKRDNPEQGMSDDVNPDNLSSDGQPAADCEVQMFNPLTWLMCPLIDGAKLAVDTLDNAITSQLTVQTDGSTSVYDEENSASGKALFNVWGAFRYISLGILVIIGLIMIISQAMSFGVFDAYTIKKVLPKILIGVIGISVSWYLCKFAIDFFNDLGIGVRSLLYGPFKDMNNAQFDAGAVSLLTIGAGIAVAGLGIVGILSFVVTALLAVIIAFGILVFRQILIMLLVITAPLAIVCWILPNTERVWKMWWDFFLRALVVFPIIALFIAGGRVIAQLATMQATQSGENNFLGSTIAFIAYFGPYFALPAAFRLAGGAIATIGGMANDRSKGVFDRLSNFRGERRKSRIARATSGGMYATPTKINKDGKEVRTLKGKLGNVGNKVTGTMFEPHNYAALYGSAALGKAGWKNNPLNRRSSEIMGKINNAILEETQEAQQHVNHVFNDKGYQALTGVHSFKGNIRDAEGNVTGKVEDELREAGLWGHVPQTFKDITKFGEILAKSDEATEARGGVALMEEAGYLSSLSGTDGTTQANIAGIGLLGWAQHGFIDPDSYAQARNNIADSSNGGPGAAVVLGTRAQLLGQDKAIDMKLGYADIPDAENPHHIKSVYEDVKRTAEMIKSHKQHDLVGAKAPAHKREAWKDKDAKDLTKGIREGGTIDLATRVAPEFGHGAADMKSMQDRIVVNAGMYSGHDDAGIQEFRDMAAAVDALTKGTANETNLVARIGQVDMAQEEMRKRESAQAPGGGGGDPAGPPSQIQPPTFH